MTGGCRVLAGAALLALVPTTAACGSTSSPTSTPSPTAVAGAATSAAPVTTTTPAATPVTVGGVAVDDLCAFLAADVPKLQGQTVGAVAHLSADLEDWYTSQGLQRPDGPQIDAATKESCPQVRGAVLLAVSQPDLRSL